MTLKEMMKKFEAYNEVRKAIGHKEETIVFKNEFVSYDFHTWKEAKATIEREYIDECAKVILASDAFEFESEFALQYQNWEGQTKDINIEIYAV